MGLLKCAQELYSSCCRDDLQSRWRFQASISSAGRRYTWEFPKIRAYFGVLILRVLLFRVLY